MLRGESHRTARHSLTVVTWINLDENYEKPPEPKPQRNPASVLECERDYDFDDLEMQLLHKQLE